MARVSPRIARKKPKVRTRTTYVKVRVIPLIPMPKSVLLRKVQESAESGVIDPDIDVRYVQYGHASGRRSVGQFASVADKVEALQDFYGVILSADTANIDRPARARRRK